MKLILFDCISLIFLLLFLGLPNPQLHLCNKHCQYHHEKLKNSAIIPVPLGKRRKERKKYEISACS